MAPVNSKKQLAESPLKKTMVEHVPLHSGSPSAQPRSPIRKRTPGAITMQQKQAMIDNMQLEITERARRLRAQYNYMATTVRSRIEMRLNRVPMSMRNIKMGDLLQKTLDQEQQRAAKSAAMRKQPATTRAASPPKQIQSAANNLKPAPRTKKRMSDAISGDKENEVEHTETAKKRARAATTTDVSHARSGQILSPTSSNSRMANRPPSPTKSGIARPASPLKRPATASGMLSSMVEKAKATRAGAGAGRKMTTNSTTSSMSTNNTAATRNKKALPATTTSRAPTSRPGTRTTRRSIANSESSESSNGTVIRKGPAAKSAPVKIGTSRKGTTGAVRKTTAKSNPSTASTGTGRTLRKRA
ncbi:Borealin N terminal-domain-containing protein [Fusarium redolens]|uniref:Borealin N terminal-domain-containing protein n=1 Tax=Fusarium redolens TaxID=48865 RepID=A0A9P9KX87_FUSRE|nr:Borealin N terminal-domain-containing protein [Fusarium redolens]KAH7270226.1 Borealin N terminal-domain-containing protein [Fusarium redolens]